MTMWNNLISFAIGNQSVARRAKRALDDVYDIHQNDDFPPDIKDLLAYAAMINIFNRNPFSGDFSAVAEAVWAL